MAASDKKSSGFFAIACLFGVAIAAMGYHTNNWSKPLFPQIAGSDELDRPKQLGGFDELIVADADTALPIELVSLNESSINVDRGNLPGGRIEGELSY